MNKEEIKHFKAMLRQGSLRHMNILLDDKFQKELLNIIKDYENLQQENQELKEIEKEHQRINGELREEIKGYQTMYFDKVMIINKAIEYIGNTRVDNDYMVQEKYEYLLEILKGDKE